jgi:hypothetical protein
MGLGRGRTSRDGPLTKEAFLVLGPESSGNHLVTDILINAGCKGHSGNHPDWHGEFEGWSDAQPWDTEHPSNETPIVWRRSTPHLKEWSDLAALMNGLMDKDYDVKAVVVVRELYPTVESQMKWRHVSSPGEGRQNVQRAYLHIFRQLDRVGIPFVVASYEALVNYPEAQDCLLMELGIALPPERLEVWDGNKKWYAKLRCRVQPEVE